MSICLVTGGAGFLGSHLVDGLLAKGHQVIALDDLSTGRLANIQGPLHRARFRFVRGSVLDKALVEDMVARCDLVYHLAAVVGVKHVLKDPMRVIMVNVWGTKNVLEAAHRYGRRVLFASTSEVYGKGTKLPFAEGDDMRIGPTWVTRWCYASTKVVGEQLCFAYAAKGLAVSIVRYFNAYGPRLNPEGYGSVVARFIAQALRGQPFTIHGDGNQTRSFTYVDDSVRGTILAATSPRALGQVFNLGSDKEISIRELALLIGELVGVRSELVFVPYERVYGASFEDVPRRVPDTSKAERVLGFKAQVSLEEGLRRTIQWFRQQML